MSDGRWVYASLILFLQLSQAYILTSCLRQYFNTLSFNVGQIELSCNEMCCIHKVAKCQCSWDEAADL